MAATATDVIDIQHIQSIKLLLQQNIANTAAVLEKINQELLSFKKALIRTQEATTRAIESQTQTTTGIETSSLSTEASFLRITIRSKQTEQEHIIEQLGQLKLQYKAIREQELRIERTQKQQSVNLNPN